MAHLNISSLGTLRFSLDHAPNLSIPSSKAQALLVYLAVESRQDHARSKLADLLWPDRSEAAARHSLSQALSVLRRSIDGAARGGVDPFIDVARRTIRFNVRSDHWLDVKLLEELRSNRYRDMALCEQAIAAYRGDFLDGFSVRHAPVFEEWQLVQREHWHRLAVAALDRLVGFYTAEGDYGKALLYAWQKLDLDPWREDGHRQVMELLALSGQRSAALAQYKTCRHILREELNSDPEAETDALHAAITAGRPLRSDRPPVPSGAVSESSPRLPVQSTLCIGREADVRAIVAMLEDGGCRLLTLVGAGGVGKTRLALEAVAPLAREGTVRSVVVPLIALDSAQAVVAAVARELGLAFSASGLPPLQQLLGHLRNKQLILILDGAEHLSRTGETPEDAGNAATDVVSAVLAAAPRVKLLVTSRIRLNVLGEHLYPVKPLGYPETTPDAPEAGTYAAIQLFAQSARRLRPTFALTERNVEAVAGICRYVRGLPLALMLTATWTPVMAVSDILRLLKGDGGQALDVLRTDWRNVAPRHRDIRVVYENSWQMVGEPAQELCQALSVFEGEFTLSEMVGVTGARLHDFRALVDAAFVDLAPRGRYVMHDLLREFVLEKLARDPATERRCRSRHAAYYVAALQRWGEDLKGPQQQAALAEMDGAIANFTLAWERSVAEGDLAAIDRSLDALRLYLLYRVRPAEAARLSKAAVDQLETPVDAQDSREGGRLRVLVRVLTWHSAFVPHEEARRVLARALRLASMAATEDDLDVRAERAAVLLRLGQVLAGTDRVAQERCLGEALSLTRETGDVWLEAAVLRSLAGLAWGRGRFRRAMRHHEDSLAIARRLEDLRGVAWSLDGVCWTASISGRAEYAAELARENLEARRALDDKAELASGLYVLGITHICLGRVGEAIPRLEECVAIEMDDLGLPAGREISMLAWARTLAGQHKPAYRLACQALPVLHAEGNPRLIAWGQFVQGSAAAALTEYGEAAKSLTDGVRGYRLLNQQLELAMTLSTLAYVYCAQGNLDQAIPLIREALPLGLDIGSPQAQAYALVGASLLALHEDSVLRAVELYALAATLMPCAERCAWFWDVAKRHIDVAATPLVAAQVSAVEERGRALTCFGLRQEEEIRL